MLTIENLTVTTTPVPSTSVPSTSVPGTPVLSTPVLENVDLVLHEGTINLLLGPNGSGKSSLAYTIMGHPGYMVTSGSIRYQGADITSWSPETRAQAGIFLALQQQIELPGLPLNTLVTESYRAIRGGNASLQAIQQELLHALELVGLDHAFATRPVHVGASGGERRRLELAQALVLRPKLVILDEIDAGVDQQGLMLLQTAIKRLQEHATVLVITHNIVFGNSLTPTGVYQMHQGTLAITQVTPVRGTPVQGTS